jgi:integrase/recombinase XerD
MMAKEYLDIDETAKLEDVAKTPRDRLLIRILSRLGCRVSEALGITVGDIDLSAGTITIVHLKSRVWLNCRQCGEKLGLRHDFYPKCGTRNQMNVAARSDRRRQRSLPLDSASANLIREFIAQGSPVLRDGKLYLFGINRHRAWQIIRQCAQKAD